MQPPWSAGLVAWLALWCRGVATYLALCSIGVAAYPGVRARPGARRAGVPSPSRLSWEAKVERRPASLAVELSYCALEVAIWSSWCCRWATLSSSTSYLGPSLLLDDVSD